MDIEKILDDLGLDLSNPEVRRGAIEAIDAILSSRISPEESGLTGGDGGGGQEVEVEIDPDLIQPSTKHQAPESPEDIEIEDEDHVLDQIKHNESEDTFDGNSSGSDQNGSEPSEANNSNETDQSTDGSESGESTADSDNEKIDSSEGAGEESKPNETDSTDDDDTDTPEEAESKSDKDSLKNDENADDGAAENSDDEANDVNKIPDESDLADEESESDKDEFDFDEADIFDNELRGVYKDKELEAKHEARKIKRERTLLAANRALADAKARKASPSLIKELESAIAALDSLQEAVKNIKNLSDDEFNLMINRVLDAIDAVGNSELTIKTAAEKELQAKEIKADLNDRNTRNELSAEDAAKIRAEVQAVKAREKETSKYQMRSASSFKGFKEFLNSLYRAIAMQVKVNELQDDTWSAISRRNVGAGVLQQGKRINELPDNKIPVIDFYFDQSGSWNASDIAVGEKAVQQLAEMEADGKIKINIYYFSNHVHSDAATARAEGGTAAWNDIVKNVIATNATNVIIMTDSDMENWWYGTEALKYTVPGYVWYLWRDGDNAPRLPRDLKGRGGVQQFSFSRGDV